MSISNEISYPLRSTLYNLEPIGIGTSMVESLTSYLIRLSNVHNLRIKSLIQYLIYPLFSESADYLKSNDSNFNRIGRFVDGCTLLTIEFINALEHLTSRMDLRNLTLISWNGITNYKVINLYKKWCPQCLDKMKEENGTFYQPLLWNIQYVSICPLHNCPLINTCPSCKRSQPALNSKGSIATCYSCNTWLSTDKYKNDEVKINCFDIWIASAIGELIIDTRKILNSPIIKLIKALESVFTDITIPIESILVFLANKYSHKTEIALKLRKDFIIYGCDDKYTDQFYNLLGLIYIIGAPVQIIYDFSSFNVSALPILNDLKDCKIKYLRNKKLFRDFDYIIHNFYPLPSPEEILRITGDTDNLLIEYIEDYLEERNILIEYNNEIKTRKPNKRR
ncbi:TniQ family protein [Ornithinibacillus halotolerans]|nr:TniQ family protein [Ornithinibacillus halotolerans]